MHNDARASIFAVGVKYWRMQHAADIDATPLSQRYRLACSAFAAWRVGVC